MGKYDKIILLSDIDGTLINSQSRVGEKNRQAISEFIKEGGSFGIATGRSLTNARSLLENTEINGYCILANGSLLYDYRKNKYIDEISLNKAEIIKFLEKCMEERKNTDIQIYTRDLSYMITPREFADPQVIKDHIPIEFASVQQIWNMSWTKILFSGNPDEIKWIKENSEYLESSHTVSRVQSAEKYYEFLPAGSSKGEMLERLKMYLEKDQTVYAVGDYYNDVEMLRNADVGIAVFNAPDEVKEYADIVCKSCNEDAIADVIENIIR